MDAGEHKHGGWERRGAYLLASALPLKKLAVTRKGMSQDNTLTGKDAARTRRP